MFYKETNYIFALQLNATYLLKDIVRDRAGVARWAHNPKVVGSNPAPATKFKQDMVLFLIEKILTSVGIFFAYFPPTQSGEQAPTRPLHNEPQIEYLQIA